jgi:hypothetical protein
MEQRIMFLPLLLVSNILIGLCWYLRPEYFLYLGLFILLVNLSAAWWLGSTRKDWWQFSLLPIALHISGLSYALMISHSSLASLVAIASLAGVVIYWRLVFLYAFHQGSFKPFSLEHSSNYLSLLAMFFGAASIFGLKTFLDLADWQLLLGGILLSLALVTQWLWFEKGQWRTHWIYAVIILVSLTEFFIALSFLPINFHLLGFMMAVMWYGLSSLFTRQIAGQLSNARARFVVVITLIVSLAVLLTARWF